MKEGRCFEEHILLFQRLVANSPSVGAGTSANVGYQSQYDADLAFQQLISSHLSRLADDEVRFINVTLKKRFLTTYFKNPNNYFFFFQKIISFLNFFILISILQKAVMKMNIQRILLDARFGPGTCIRIIQVRRCSIFQS